MFSANLNIARLLDCTEAEGPGRRACLWVQGCLRKCPGCCNSAMWGITPRQIVSADEIAERFLLDGKTHHLEGITFLGGEPMLQARGLAVVARRCRAGGLSVVTFTGYTLEECRSSPLPGMADLLEQTDVLIDGPFVQDEYDESRNWVGSLNQRFHYLTDRYDSSIETDPRYRGVVELRDEGGELHANGCPKTLTDQLVNKEKNK